MLVAAPASPPPPPSSAAKPDPDAVSTMKLLAAATAAASVYGAFRLVQLYLGKDKLQRYVDTVRVNRHMQAFMLKSFCV